MAEYHEYESVDEVRDKPVVRCKACIKRFEVPLDTTVMDCPYCGKKWRISWPQEGVAYLQGEA
jgi:DNA-directed RNA polymerase subunit RPC12/RpoP